MCTLCHGERLSGGTVPDEDDGPKAPNITAGGALGSWTKSQFVDTLRSGITPEGQLLDFEFMPWNRFNQMTDDEMDAIWLYLQSLPAREFEE